MYKLLGIILAAIPFILFLRTFFMGRLKRSQAVSDFRRQIDYLVWMILILIGCAVVYSIGKLILPEATLYHFQGGWRSGGVGLTSAPRWEAAGAIGGTSCAANEQRRRTVIPVGPACSAPVDQLRLEFAPAAAGCGVA
jgi:hypothetical protein